MGLVCNECGDPDSIQNRIYFDIQLMLSLHLAFLRGKLSLITKNNVIKEILSSSIIRISH